MITYQSAQIPQPHAVEALYRDVHLDRAVQGQDRIQHLLQASNVLYSAWIGERLVGLLRGWTDGRKDGFICDVAVHPDVAGEGVARELIAMVQNEHPWARWVFHPEGKMRLDLAGLGWKKDGEGWIWQS